MYNAYCLRFNGITADDSKVIASIIEARISDRCSAKLEENGYLINIVISVHIPQEEYRISDIDEGLLHFAEPFFGIVILVP